MPKASQKSTARIEGGMLSLVQASKTTARMSGRLVAARGNIRHSAMKKNDDNSKKPVIEHNVAIGQSATNVKKSREAIQVMLDSLEEETMHESWRHVLEGEITKPYFTRVPSGLLK